MLEVHRKLAQSSVGFPLPESTMVSVLSKILLEIKSGTYIYFLFVMWCAIPSHIFNHACGVAINVRSSYKFNFKTSMVSFNYWMTGNIPVFVECVKILVSVLTLLISFVCYRMKTTHLRLMLTRNFCLKLKKTVFGQIMSSCRLCRGCSKETFGLLPVKSRELKRELLLRRWKVGAKETQCFWVIWANFIIGV